MTNIPLKMQHMYHILEVLPILWGSTLHYIYDSSHLHNYIDKTFLPAARERRWKSGRRGGGRGDRGADESDNGAGSDESWDSGKETADAQVDE